jgi:hypothetical protein
MNYPPQSTNSSIMKYALCLMKTHIEDNDLDDKVKLLPSAVPEVSLRITWAITQTELMEKLLCMLYPRELQNQTSWMEYINILTSMLL